MVTVNIVVTVRELDWEIDRSVELDRVPVAGESIDFGNTSIVKVDDVWHTPFGDEVADLFCSVNKPNLLPGKTMGDWLDWQEARGFDVNKARAAWNKACAEGRE